jgi:gpW
MATAEQFTTWRDEAEQALHRLATGSMVEEIAGPNNMRTRFMAADMDKLQKYIEFLDGQISRVTSGMRQRPIYFTPRLG